jgi:hypothetical protein
MAPGWPTVCTQEGFPPLLQLGEMSCDEGFASNAPCGGKAVGMSVDRAIRGEETPW